MIVEHYTVTTTFGAAWNTFAPDRPDSELHELPGLCAHFIVGADGTIYQLVSLRYICRHTVGLNGHAMSLSSPFHHERVPRLRDQTHGDWTAKELAPLRRRLGRYRCPA